MTVDLAVDAPRDTLQAFLSFHTGQTLNDTVLYSALCCML
jgi:hypothetical protein